MAGGCGEKTKPIKANLEPVPRPAFALVENAKEHGLLTDDC